MDVLSPLIHLVLKSLVVLFPLSVGFLAFRRLALSKSANAWLYAAMCLFAAVTAAGVLPWSLGLTPLNWSLMALAFSCPVLWIGVIVLCDMSRINRYGPDPLLLSAQAAAKRYRIPLLLKNPVDIEAPQPVFKHVNKTPEKKPAPGFSSGTKSILSLARDIRGNPTSDRRRPKLLPPPDAREFPFLNGSRDA